MSETEFTGYADNSTPYIASNNIGDVIRILENDSIRLFKSFSDNQVKVNQDKYHLIVSNNEDFSIKIDDIEVESSHCEKLLSIKMDSKLNFKDHEDGVIKKASRKVNILSCITPT